MIELGIRKCDCCEEEAETLYLYKHVDRYNRIHKQALCLECFKDNSRVYVDRPCEDCGEHAEEQYEVDGKFYCEDCLENYLTSYDGKEITEESLRAEYDNQQYDLWKGDQ